MARAPTVLGQALNKYLRHAEAHGHDPAALLSLHGIGPEDLRVDARIPLAALLDVQERIAERKGDPALGIHVAEESPPREYDVLGFLALNSATLGEAFERVGAYFRIWQEGSVLGLETAGQEAALVYRIEGLSPNRYRQDAEHTLAALTLAARTLVGATWRPTLACFAHDGTKTAAHERVFGSVRFGSETTRLRFDANTLALPIRGSDPSLGALMDRYAQQLVSELGPSEGVVEEVRTVLTESLTRGIPELSSVARRIGQSERSLQRRLAETGTSYREVVDAYRHELALKHVKRGALPVSEIAFLLGYGDETAFRRAFRRWTGRTPAAVREGRVAGP